MWEEEGFRGNLGAEMGLEDLEPIFGEPKAEWRAPTSTPPPLPPFLFHLRALDPSRLRLLVTDFHSNTWESTRTVQQLEDMRDNIGIGGPWTEFVDYMRTSIKNGDVKIVFEGQSKADGPASAKFVTQKSKGMPVISFPLVKLAGSAAGDAMANLSLELYKAYISNRTLLIDEQERHCQLTRSIVAEQEKNESIQRQLDSLLYTKRQKSQMYDVVMSKSSSAATVNGASNKQASHNPNSSKARVMPAHRRANVRGVLLKDTEDD